MWCPRQHDHSRSNIAPSPSAGCMAECPTSRRATPVTRRISATYVRRHDATWHDRGPPGPWPVQPPRDQTEQSRPEGASWSLPASSPLPLVAAQPRKDQSGIVHSQAERPSCCCTPSLIHMATVTTGGRSSTCQDEHGCQDEQLRVRRSSWSCRRASWSLHVRASVAAPREKGRRSTRPPPPAPLL
jgi:hypothetical protein